MFTNSTSDETVLRLRRKWEVSERVLEPLEMSDTERYKFIECDCISVKRLGHGWLVTMDGGRDFFGQSLEDAIGNAAGHAKEMYGV